MVEGGSIKRILVDITAPTDMELNFIAKELLSLEGIKKVKIKVDEVEEDIKHLSVEILGNDLQPEKIEDKILELGLALHGIDELEVER